MSVTIELDLPEGLAMKARAKGLLDSKCVTELISAELRRQEAAAQLNAILTEIRAQPGEAPTAEEIQAEIKAVRQQKRPREAGC